MRFGIDVDWAWIEFRLDLELIWNEFKLDVDLNFDLDCISIGFGLD